MFTACSCIHYDTHVPCSAWSPGTDGSAELIAGAARGGWSTHCGLIIVHDVLRQSLPKAKGVPLVVPVLPAHIQIPRSLDYPYNAPSTIRPSKAAKG